MATTLDINIVSKKFIDIKDIFNILNTTFNLNIKTESIEILDDWEYSNVINIEKMEDVFNYVEENKIAIIYFKIYDKWSAGCFLEKVQDGYLIAPWINTLNLEYLDCEIVNEKTDSFYNEVINIILGQVKKYDISIAAIGVETIFEYEKDIRKVVNGSYNINTWIIKKSPIRNLNKYTTNNYEELEITVFKRFE